jgi:Ca-activated chloride channel family protein
VPDASRITPPVLLPGFPNPLRLSLDVDIDPAGLPLGEVRSSLHTVVTEGGRVSLRPGERADRDFVLRLAYGSADESSTLVCVPDDDGDEGTYRLTLLPPTDSGPVRGRDVVLLLDRSGSMRGWKMVAARRAAARIVDTLTDADRFAVLTFDHEVGHPDNLPTGLVEATDRHRFRAVEHLARADARGGTELLAPLRDGLALLSGDSPREPVLVLVTDGQVGNEDQILREITPGRVRVHTVGIDRAVNAGFLGRLAALGGGRCELVESEDRLDEAMEHIHRRIGAPLVTDLAITADGLALVADTRTPDRLPALYRGVPLVISGRYRGPATGSLTVTGRTRDDRPWRTTVAASGKEAPAVTALWARARLRDLEDRYAAGSGGADLERLAVDTSLRFGVLCRFTAYVAVDSRVVTEGGKPHRVVQPVEPVSGWDLLAAPAVSGGGLRMMAMGGSGPARGSMMMAAEMMAADAPVHGRRQPPGGVLPNLRAAVAGTAGAPWHAAPTAGVDLRSLREVAAVEARRLRESAERPEYERRELLADLGSRLTALVGGRTEPEYEPLRRLAATLDAGGDLAARWAEALRVLEEFARGEAQGGTADPDRRRTFWRRG